MATQYWKSTERLSSFEVPPFSAGVDPHSPAQGLLEPRVAGEALDDLKPLCVQIAEVEAGRAASDVEVYTRGTDLVATYADRPEPAMRTQIYWRAATPATEGSLGGVELVASVQTSLLDSCPRLVTSSEVTTYEAFKLVDVASGRFNKIAPQSDWSAAQTLSAPPHCFLFRLVNQPISYVEMVDPTGAERSDWDSWLAGGFFRMRLRHHLFANQLEKGVILRSRVLGLLIPRANDLAVAAGHYAKFLAAELPLTT